MKELDRVLKVKERERERKGRERVMKQKEKNELKGSGFIFEELKMLTEWFSFLFSTLFFTVFYFLKNTTNDKLYAEC